MPARAVAPLGVLVFCAGLSIALVRSITRPLARAASLAGALAQGSLTLRDADVGRDATGRVPSALDEVGRNLTLLGADIRTTAEQISTASGRRWNGSMPAALAPRSRRQPTFQR